VTSASAPTRFWPGSTWAPCRPTSRAPDLPTDLGTVREVVLHLVEETARHAGHLDIARELLDGRTGLGPR
jgi:hypothetical protein